MELFLILFLGLIIYLGIKVFPLLYGIYRVLSAQRSMHHKHEQERQRQEKAWQRANPEQTSVERINETSLDLEGGEYIDYEEVEGDLAQPSEKGTSREEAGSESLNRK